MVELTKTQKIIIAVGIICILIVIGIFLYKRTQDTDYSTLMLEPEEEVKENNIEQEQEKIENKIKVHVAGYVEEEGMVELAEGARIADALEAAGGATLEADLSRVNLAYVLQDGQTIYIPSTLAVEEEEAEEEEYITEGSGGVILEEEEGEEEKNNEAEGKVNINTTTQTELETLNGIGPSTASKIIEYRKQNGNFQSIEEIQNVSGIGDSKYESIKDDICV